ncbi:MAG: HEAT repeat domain-containing protein [Candidatus Wallbacteria bacterium]|nr:HEAT repeat domain-containing protein [Candidatus Wallbacteria bacterium]
MAAEQTELNSKNPQAQRNALKDLIKNGDIASIRDLEKFTCERTSSELYYLARKGIEILKDKFRIEPSSLDHGKGNLDRNSIVNLLVSDDPWKRIKAIQNLTINDRKEYLPDLRERLKNEKNNYVIATIVKGLGLLGGMNEIPSLKDFLRHNDSRIRANTVEALSAMNTVKIYPLIIPLLKDESPRVKINVAKALVDYKEMDILTTIKSMLCSNETWQLESVLYFLSQTKIADDEIRFCLIELLRKAKTESLRKRINDTLRELSVKNLNTISAMIKDAQVDELKILEKKVTEKHLIDRAQELSEKVPELPKTEHEKLIQQAKNGDFHQKRQALVDMLNFPRKEYTRVLLEIAKTDHPVLRYFALKGLARIQK